MHTTHRLEAFSDGVFAIVITLLILEIRVPELAEGESLGQALIAGWPAYLAFVMSFALVGIMWINHSRLFRLIRSADNTLLVLNLLLLLGVTVVPFPTALLAEYLGHPEEKTATLVYTGWSVVIAVFFNLLWRYAAGRRHLMGEAAEQPAIQAISRTYLLGPAVYLVATGVALWNVRVAVGLTLALAVFFLLPAEWVVARKRRRS